MSNELKNRVIESFMWRAVLEDGTVVDEFSNGEEISVTTMIGKKELSKFGIVNINDVFLNFDIGTGIFNIFGKHNFDIKVTDMNNNSLDKEDQDRTKLVMFRTVEEMFENGKGSSVDINSYSFGYKTENDKAHIVRFIEINKTKGMIMHIYITGKVTEKVKLIIDEPNTNVHSETIIAMEEGVKIKKQINIAFK